MVGPGRDPHAAADRGLNAVSETDIGVLFGTMGELDWLSRELGQRIREVRERASPRLTQEALAQRVGLARTSITNIESGNQQPTIHALWRMADALDVSPCELLPPWPRADARSPSNELPHDVPAGTRAFLERLTENPTRRRA